MQSIGVNEVGDGANMIVTRGRLLGVECKRSRMKDSLGSVCILHMARVEIVPARAPSHRKQR